MIPSHCPAVKGSTNCRLGPRRAACVVAQAQTSVSGVSKRGRPNKTAQSSTAAVHTLLSHDHTAQQQPTAALLPKRRGRPRKLQSLEPVQGPSSLPLPAGHAVSSAATTPGPADGTGAASGSHGLLGPRTLPVVHESEIMTERARTNPVYRMIRKTELQLAWRGPRASSDVHPPADSTSAQHNAARSTGSRAGQDPAASRAAAPRGSSPGKSSSASSRAGSNGTTSPAQVSSPVVYSEEMASEGAWRNPVYRLIRKTQLRLKQRQAAADFQPPPTTPSPHTPLSQPHSHTPAPPQPQSPPTGGLASLLSLGDSLLSLAALEQPPLDMSPGGQLARGLAASLDPEAVSVGHTPHKHHTTHQQHTTQPPAPSHTHQHTDQHTHQHTDQHTDAGFQGSGFGSLRAVGVSTGQRADGDVDSVQGVQGGWVRGSAGAARDGPLPALPSTGHVGVDRAIRIRQLTLSQRRKQQDSAARAQGGDAAGVRPVHTGGRQGQQWPATVSQRAMDYQLWYPKGPIENTTTDLNTTSGNSHTTIGNRDSKGQAKHSKPAQKDRIQHPKRGRPRTRPLLPATPPKPRGRPRLAPHTTARVAWVAPEGGLEGTLAERAAELASLLEPASGSESDGSSGSGGDRGSAEQRGVTKGAVTDAAVRQSRSMLRSQPNLLYRRAESLAANLTALAKTLNLPQARVVDAVRLYPPLLELSPVTAQERYKHLMSLTQQHCPDMRPLDLAEAVCQCPVLLGLTPDKVTSHVTALASALSPAVTPQAANHRPSSQQHGRPTEAPAAQSSTATEQGSEPSPAAMGLAWRVLLTNPGLSRCSTDKLASKAARLVSLSHLHPRWSQDMRTLKPAYLGRCLAASERVHSRLAYVASLVSKAQESTSGAHTVQAAGPGTTLGAEDTAGDSSDMNESLTPSSDMLSLGSILLQTHAAFVSRFPGFERYTEAQQL